MGGSVAMGADCERRSTTASEEASPKTASRIAERDMFARLLPRNRGGKKAEQSKLYLRLTVYNCLPVTGRLYLIIPGHCTRRSLQCSTTGRPLSAD